MQAQVSLTVSASKRLIAKGIVEYQPVLEALREGWVAVTKGSTNAYILEELTGKTIDKRKFITGHRIPNHMKGKTGIANQLPDLVLHKGQPVEGLSATDALKEMGTGDVFFKGANAINYEDGLAGLLIGHPTGGTIGAAIGTLTAKRINLIIPVGLEKQIPFSIVDASVLMGPGNEEHPKNFPALWPLYGDLFTEIEAFTELFDVDAYPVAAGGLAGAEGGIQFCLHGETRSVHDALKLIEDIGQEPPFVS